MASDVMIILIENQTKAKSKKSTEELKVDILFWWPKEELKKDPRFALYIDLGSYYDYSAILSRSAALEMHQQFLPLTTQEIYSSTSSQEIIQKKIKALEELLAKGNDETLFEVCVYEWESGY